jgi:uncharacterized damage-inducible protein DinB
MHGDLIEPVLPFIRDLFRFNQWAGDRLIEGVRLLDHGSLYRGLPAGWKNLHQILVHIHAVEILYLARWHGSSPNSLLDAGDFFGVDDLARKWESVYRNMHFFLECCDEADLDLRIRFVRMNGESMDVSLLDMLAHTVMHSIFHRGQIQHLIHSYGHEPKPIDPLVFFLTNGSQSATPQTLLRELVEYTRWAEERTFLSLRTLTPDRLRESYGGGIGSAWETQVHVIGALGGWLERMDGQDEFRMIGPNEISGLDELAALQDKHLTEMENIARVREDLSDRITIHDRRHTLSVTRAQLLFQLLTHAVYHRGQTMMMVRFSGGAPQDTDFMTYAQTKATVNA